MRASLPMYTFDAEANAAFWQALAAAFRTHGLADVPDRLENPAILAAHWLAADLFLSQTCGYPLVTHLKRQVEVVGTFHYAAPGCRGMYYTSVLVARADDARSTVAAFRGARAAYNGVESQSGYNCLRAVVAPLAGGKAFFGETLATGAHYRSLKAVAEGEADLAAIDCISFAGFIAQEPALGRAVKVIGHTPEAPGLPIIMRAGSNAATLEAMRAGLADVIADERLAPIRARLMIAGFTPTRFEDYAGILAMEEGAIAAGYPVLA